MVKFTNKLSLGSYFLFWWCAKDLSNQVRFSRDYVENVDALGIQPGGRPVNLYWKNCLIMAICGLL